MTSITYVSQKEMKQRTGLGHALGYTFPEKGEILLRKGLPKKLKKEVLAHEEEHLIKGEEGPFWTALGAAAAKWGPSLLSAAGGLFGGGEQEQPVPFSATKNSERDRLYALNSALYGANPDGRGSGVNHNAGTGQGGYEALFNNPENFMTYGPQPFAPANPYELAAIHGLGSFGAQAFPDLYGGFTDTVRSGASGLNSPLQAYTSSLQNTLPMLQDALSQTPQVSSPNFDPNQFSGLFSGQQDAINSLMGGNLDTNLFQGAIDSYLQPAMEQFNEQLLPAFQRADAAATGGQSSAGALKAAQRTQEQIGEGLGAYLGGRLFDASQNAANRVGQGVGLAQNQIGMQGNLANIRSGFDFNAGLANQGASLSQTGNLLNAAGLGSGAASNMGSQMLGYSSQYPSLLNAGMLGPQALAMAGEGQRGLEDPYYQYGFNQHMFNQQQPFQMANDWFNMLNGSQNINTSATQQTTGGSNLLAGLGGLLANWPKSTAGDQGSWAPYMDELIAAGVS